MKLFIFTITSLLLASPTWADSLELEPNHWGVELTLISERTYGACATDDSVLIKEAQDLTLEKAGSDLVRVSRWKSHAGVLRGPYADPDSCDEKSASAEALFVHKSQVGQTYFVTLNIGFSNPRNNWEVPGDNLHTEEEAWNASLAENTKYAQKFCKSLPSQHIRSKSKKIFEGSSWYDLYTVEVRFQCEL